MREFVSQQEFESKTPKFIYDFDDKKTLKSGIELYRIVASRNISNPYCKISKGEKGGYIALNTLSQSGECWVDEDSFVGPDCYISGDSYVVGSTLTHNVRIGNSSAISYSKLSPKKKSTVFGGSIVVSSNVKGDINLSGTARLDDCKVVGELSMTDECIIQNCEVSTKKEGLSLVGKTKYLDKKISGFGPITYADTVVVTPLHDCKIVGEKVLV